MWEGHGGRGRIKVGCARARARDASIMYVCMYTCVSTKKKLSINTTKITIRLEKETVNKYNKR